MLVKPATDYKKANWHPNQHESMNVIKLYMGYIFANLNAYYANRS